MDWFLYDRDLKSIHLPQSLTNSPGYVSVDTLETPFKLYLLQVSDQ